MIRSSTLMLALACATIPAAASLARPVTYTVPADKIPAALSGTEAEVVVSNCGACHSLDYIATQPRHKGVQFWRDAVTKMINVYKAPIAPADAEAAANVLAKKFG